jgi:hypothetical protein
LPKISRNILPSTRRTLFRTGPTSQTPYQILVLTSSLFQTACVSRGTFTSIVIRNTARDNTTPTYLRISSAWSWNVPNKEGHFFLITQRGTPWFPPQNWGPATVCLTLTSVGEFMKTCYTRNIEFNEVLKICFSGARHLRFSGIWEQRSLGVANTRFSGILNLRRLRFANMQFSGILNRRSLGVVNMRKSGISIRRSHELRKTADSGICQKSGLEVVHWEIHELVRSKVRI